MTVSRGTARPARATGPARAAAVVVDVTIAWVLWVLGAVLLIETGVAAAPPRATAPALWLWTLVVIAAGVVYRVRRGPAGRTVGQLVVDVTPPTPPMDVATDPTEAAIRSASIDAASAWWVRAVAAQVPARLDIAAPGWRDGQVDIEQRAQCLLLAALALAHPAQRAALHAVLDNHPTLGDVAGDPLSHLHGLLSDAPRARRWLGLPDGSDLQTLLDTTVAGGGS